MWRRVGKLERDPTTEPRIARRLPPPRLRATLISPPCLDAVRTAEVSQKRRDEKSMKKLFPRCRITPLPDQRASFAIDGREVCQWVFSRNHPRPFFFPLIGPSGGSLTRMGHPGAPNHDHHRSVWFAHNQVLGIDFWSDNSEARIEQQQWLAYEDSDARALMAVQLAWRDGHDPEPLLQQELVVCVEPLDERQWSLELQSRFTPTAATLEFRKTNFGFLAVRVAKHLTEFFGGGKLTNSEGADGERAIFGRPAKWMDYSGPAPDGGQEGVAYLDHPDNPGQPTRWHVRADGWMGASPCMLEPLTTSKDSPLTLRYKLVVHRGGADRSAIDGWRDAFAAAPAWRVERSSKPHTHREINRDA